MPLVPTQNPPALIAYYLGIASLIPCLGMLLGLPAIICGIIGAIKANSTPGAGGMGHAIAGIILGILGPAIWPAIYFLFAILSAG